MDTSRQLRLGGEMNEAEEAGREMMKWSLMFIEMQEAGTEEEMQVS
jgi:hypothetical protein